MESEKVYDKKRNRPWRKAGPEAYYQIQTSEFKPIKFRKLLDEAARFEFNILRVKKEYVAAKNELKSFEATLAPKEKKELKRLTKEFHAKRDSLIYYVAELRDVWIKICNEATKFDADPFVKSFVRLGAIDYLHLLDKLRSEKLGADILEGKRFKKLVEYVDKHVKPQGEEDAPVK